MAARRLGAGSVAKVLKWIRGLARHFDQADRVLVQLSARAPRTATDRALKGLSKAANHSALWLCLATALVGKKGPTRRGALRGITAIAGSSATTNLAGKPLFPRRRPAAELVPTHRRLSDPPTSSSFPSGHAASAAAFATAIAMESPLTGAVIAPVAAAVAYSRVHTGVHWPTDVACGAALGAGIAWATKRWWPLRPDKPAQVRHHTAAPALPGGEGMLALINPVSGFGAVDPADWIRTHWPQAAVFYPAPERDLATELDTHLEHNGQNVRALGVAGGDGTVAAVASVATRRRMPLAVLSTGTLNHFAKDVGLEDLTSVVAAVDTGTAVTLDLSGVTVDDRPPRWFINTASLGGYPDMVRFRQKWAPRWGKWPAAAAALVRVLYESMPLEVRINGERHRVWVLFIGNGSYEPRGFAPTWRPNLDNGLLDVRYVRADARFSRLRFVFAAISGALHRSHTYVQRDYREIEVAVRGRPVAVATDGEVGPRGNHFRFAASDKALSVYRPSVE